MPLLISCRDVGVDCDFMIHGRSVGELVQEAAVHAVAEHNCTEEQVSRPDWLEQMRAAMRSASRPASLTTPRPIAPYGTGHPGT